MEVKYEPGKVLPSEDTYRSEQISKAYAGVLKGVLGREPTHAEILGKVDISRAKKHKFT